MPFIKAILIDFLKDLLTNLSQWVIKKYKENKETKKDKEKTGDAIELVKDSKTPEEIDDALDAITDRSDVTK